MQALSIKRAGASRRGAGYHMLLSSLVPASVCPMLISYSQPKTFLNKITNIIPRQPSVSSGYTLLN